MFAEIILSLVIPSKQRQRPKSQGKGTLIPKGTS